MRIERAALCIADMSKAAAGAPMRISGWASTYDNSDRLGRIMKVGAFGSTLGGKAHSGMNFTSFKLPMLGYHQDETPVGASDMQPEATIGMRHESGLAPTGRSVNTLVVIYFPWDPRVGKFAGERIHYDSRAFD